MKQSGFPAFFQRVAEALGIGSQAELASLLGVNRSAVSQAKRKDTVPEKWILHLSRTSGLNPDWLEHGRGLPRDLGHHDPDFARIPKVRARLCAGGGSFENESQVQGYYAFRHDWLRRKGNPGRMVLMDIVGDSMDPVIREGDTALIDQSQEDILAGSIYAVGVEDTVMVKRIEKRPNALVLLSANRDYTPITLQGEEIDTVRVIGKVIWIGRELY